MLSMILAMDKNNLVGKTGTKSGLPWYYKEDLQFYKKMTTNKKNIMGRETFDSIGFALPNRETYVLSRNKSLNYVDANVIDLKEADRIIKENPKEEIMLVGGVQVFELLKDKVDKIYLTFINKEYEGDVFYKEFDTEGFELIETIQGENKELEFQTWIRK